MPFTTLIIHQIEFNRSSNWPVITGTKSTTEQAIIFGLGSMFNHSSSDQNVGWERDIARGVVVYKALRDIQVGEELCLYPFSLLPKHHPSY